MQPNQKDVSDTRTVRHDPAEDWSNSRSIDPLSLFPLTIVAFGSPTAPGERLMALQSGIARLAGVLANFRLSSFRLSRPARRAGVPRHIF